MSEAKRCAGRAAADLVEGGMVVGLGTGSTVLFVLERLAERIRREGLEIRGIPTSLATAEAAGRLGIPLTDFETDPGIDLAIDGADEVDPSKDLIKGGGGALLREKIVMAAARDSVVVVSEEKCVERLGVGFLLPVEVVPFGWVPCSRALLALGCKPLLRHDAAGRRVVTDNGNLILDCRFPGIDDPAGLEREIDRIPGVAGNGLFVGLAGRVLVGSEGGGVREL